MPFRIQPFIRLLLICGMTSLLAGYGISATSIYSGTGMTFDLNERGVTILGAVNMCQGAFCKNDETGRTEWPLSLAAPPPASHYQAVLRKKSGDALQHTREGNCARRNHSGLL